MFSKHRQYTRGELSANRRGGRKSEHDVEADKSESAGDFHQQARLMGRCDRTWIGVTGRMSRTSEVRGQGDSAGWVIR